MVNDPCFIHLRVHSEYSLIDSTVRLPALLQAAKDDSMPAVALSDHSNMFALVKFFKKSLAAGIKPIIGADIELQDENDKDKTSKCTLLCLNDQGFINLKCILSEAYTCGQEEFQRPVVSWSWLEKWSHGLIALSGAMQGDIAQALLTDNESLAVDCLQRWQKCFKDRFYIECQRIGQPQEAIYIQRVVALAQKQKLPVVATVPVCFISEDDFEAHEARVCIQHAEIIDDPNRRRKHTRQQYFKTQSQMQQLFSDMPTALQNTVEIAKRCNVKLKLGQNFLPTFPVPEGMTEADFLSEESLKGLELRMQQESFMPEGFTVDQYKDRLKLELDVIIKMGFPGYFLIVADFIRWSKQNDIPVGPGRGSGAGSLVAYVLGITDIDPLRYQLLFERFLNPERVSLPDFDVDFCMDGRDRVINYVAERYGRQCVSQIITYGTMAAKAVVRDVGRVQGLSYGLCDSVAKLIPFEIGMTLNKALEQEPRLQERYDDEDDVRALLDMAKKLEGLTRNAGKHAGGVVIAPTKLTDFSPLYCEPGSDSIVTQFDKDDAEEMGLVKFDFLGLRTLTIINWALRAVNKTRKEQGEDDLKIENLPMHDEKVFALLDKCASVAVFQLESRGMRDLIRRLKPDSFEDIVALVALFRPGPLQSGMVDDFIERKHGRAKVVYPHSCLEEILKPTYGIILYQEQVMQIAQVFSGFSLGAADLLRRAMGKKKHEEMEKQRKAFVDGAVAKDKDAKLASDLFDLIEKFAGYGFNKSHSAAYALISYQTAWLKAHYPAEFMAAVLSSDMDNTDKLVGFVNEVSAMGMKLLGVDINLSQYYFHVNDDKKIVYGLGAVKGVGEGAVECLIDEREKNGPYKSLFDLCARVDLRKLNKRAIEPLIFSGAFDNLGVNRATLFSNMPRAMHCGEKKQQEKAIGQRSLFDLFDDNDAVEGNNSEYQMQQAWMLEDRLQKEYQALGLYFSSHPLAPYEEELSQVTQQISAVKLSRKKMVAVAGLVVSFRIIRTKKDKNMAVLQLSDRSGSIDITAFSEVLDVAQPLLQKGAILVIKGELADDTFSGGKKIMAKKIITLDEVRMHCAKTLLITIKQGVAVEPIAAALPAVLAEHQGGECAVMLRYQRQKCYLDIPLAATWHVIPTAALLKKVMQLCGDDAAELQYSVAVPAG